MCIRDSTPAELIPVVGKNAAALCQLIHYRTRNSKIESGGKSWLVLSAEKVAETLRCSVRTVQRAIACLRAHGLIHTTRLFAHHYNQTLAYRPNYEAIEAILQNAETSESSADPPDPSKCQSEARQSDATETATLAQSTYKTCLLYTSPSPRDLSTSRMPSSA